MTKAKRCEKPVVSADCFSIGSELLLSKMVTRSGNDIGVRPTPGLQLVKNRARMKLNGIAID